jgi:hypothetical protein
VLVELLPAPLHDDERAFAPERVGDAVDHLCWIGDVLQ